MSRTAGVAKSTPAPCRPVPARAGLPVDEEEMRRWLARLLERGFKESTARLWVSRVRTAYAHGVDSPDAVDAAFENFANNTRCGMRQALRELDTFRRSS